MQFTKKQLTQPIGPGSATVPVAAAGVSPGAFPSNRSAARDARHCDRRRRRGYGGLRFGRAPHNPDNL
jgi:hypothetical protein